MSRERSCNPNIVAKEGAITASAWMYGSLRKLPTVIKVMTTINASESIHWRNPSYAPLVEALVLREQDLIQRLTKGYLALLRVSHGVG
jgi:hypothetical protein